MSNKASAESAQSATTESFTTAIVINAAVFGAQVFAFVILRPQFRKIYEPRTFLPPPKLRQAPLPRDYFTWPLAILRTPLAHVVRKNGLDSFMFLRFLRLCVKILAPIWFLSWVVLMPVDAVQPTAGQKGLNIFTYGNVDTNAAYPRYAAHLLCAWIFTFWILYNIKVEMTYFVHARQRFLIDKDHSLSAQANTVLITGVPRSELTQAKLQHIFSFLPGEARKIWINHDLKDLPDLHDRRVDACNKLDSALTAFAKIARKLQLAREKAANKSKPAPKKTVVDEADADPEKKRGVAERLVPRAQRPTHKLGFFGLLGEKVDTIDWCREEIAKLNEEIVAERKEVASNPDKYPPLSSCFVLFNQQIAAHLCVQALTHHAPYRMAEKYTEVGPDDIVWSNLGINPYERQVRHLISYALTAGLIILWAFPVAFVGALSNITTLAQEYPWLGWLEPLPRVVKGIISGILPPVLLAVLFLLLPIVLRLFAQLEGIPRRTGIELSLMTRYFIFLVIHGFLIVTLASGIIKSLPLLVNANATTFPTILANNLPGASIFFLTYVILQGLSGSSGSLLQIATLIIYYVKLWILGSTPRSVFHIRHDMPSVAWGTLFPNITLLMVITLAYSVIAPVMNGLATVTFCLFYFTYKYLFLWVYDMPRSSDTGGLFFPKAIQHIFVGMYISQVCLAALFFLARKGPEGNMSQAALPQGILMIILIVCTALLHMTINSSYGPLINALPLTLAGKSFSQTETPVTEVGDDERISFQRQSGDNSVPLAELGAGQSVSDAKKGSADANGVQVTHYASRDAPAPTQPNAQASDNIDDNGALDDPTGPLDCVRDIGSIAQGGHETLADDAFVPPAMKDDQIIIWAPRDDLGISEEQVARLVEAKVQATTEGAYVDKKGHVQVIDYPPGEYEFERKQRAGEEKSAAGLIFA